MQDIANGRKHCVFLRREILFVSLVRDKHCCVLLFICIFFKSVNIFLAFWVNVPLPQVGKFCVPSAL